MIIDLSEVPRTVLDRGWCARAFVFDVSFGSITARVPITLVCDEAHLYLPAGEERLPNHQAALAAFESIAKEGRKYGLGLLIGSQRPTDVSATVLSQCNNFIVMRITDDRDQAMIERLLPESVPGIKGVLPVLDVGEGVVISDATCSRASQVRSATGQTVQCDPAVLVDGASSRQQGCNKHGR
jgi:DNA helicase HerA-like ATPase